MSTYRACYWQSPDGQYEIVLTLPEHSEFPDYKLRAEAIATAYMGNIVAFPSSSKDDPRIAHDVFMAGLRIGPWTN